MSIRAAPETLRPLPIQVRPKPAETIESYVRRLARANHLRPSYLHAYLCGPPDYLGTPDLQRLAALSGRPTSVLHRTLTEPTPSPPPPPPARQPRPPRPRPWRLPPAAPPRTLKTRNRTELFAAIRHDDQTLDLSIRALTRRYHVGTRTILQALASPTPPPRKKLPPRESRLDPYKRQIDTILEQDRTMPRRQRHTIRRIWERLIDEHDAHVSYGMVRDYVAHRRRQHQAAQKAVATSLS
jgi:hypothetical protein